MPARQVLIVLFDGVQSLDVTGPLEVFATAADYQQDLPGGAAVRPSPYQVRTASLTGLPVRSSSGLGLIPDDSLTGIGPGDVDTLIVPGGSGTRTPAPALVSWLRDMAPVTRRIASVCTGAFVLAAAGLLAGRRCTTHWAYGDALARQFPEVNVDIQPIFVRDGNLVTSAGVTAGIDLALALVEEDIGREAALEVARHLVVYLRRPGSQAQFSAQLRAQSAQRAPLREVQQWITEHPDADLSVEALAAMARLSPRHFARAFAAETGISPGKHVAAVRLEAARRLLEDRAGVEETARACGYRTTEAMRRAFIKSLGVPPASYRHKF
jgi:transcriptional regulator GlxA family with amidase domain